MEVHAFDGEPHLVDSGDGTGEDGVGKRLFPRGRVKSPQTYCQESPSLRTVSRILDIANPHP
jgi:hypothetical protein